MTPEDKEKLYKIRKHLGELHDRWSKSDEPEFGHKSNEGYVGILYRLPNWFECSNVDEYINAKPELSMIEVYSYLFGPNRLHTFNTISEAYEEVIKWN